MTVDAPAGVSRTSRLPGLLLTEHEFTVPLDHARPGGEQLTVFAREVAGRDAPEAADRPYSSISSGIR